MLSPGSWVRRPTKELEERVALLIIELFLPAAVS